MAAGEPPRGAKQKTPLRRRRPPPLCGPQYFSLTALSSVRPGGPGGTRSVERGDRKTLRGETGCSPSRCHRGSCSPPSCSPPAPCSGRSTPNPPAPRSIRPAGPGGGRAEEAGISVSPQPRGHPPRPPPRPPPMCAEALAAKACAAAPIWAEELSPVRLEAHRRLHKLTAPLPVTGRKPPPPLEYTAAECMDGDSSLLSTACQWAEGPCHDDAQTQQSSADTSFEGAEEGSAHRSLAEGIYGPPPARLPWGGRKSSPSHSPCRPACRTPTCKERLYASPRSMLQGVDRQHRPGARICPSPSGAATNTSPTCRKQRTPNGAPSGFMVAGSLDLRRPSPRFREAPSPRTYTPQRQLP